MIRAVWLVLFLLWFLPNAPAEVVPQEGYKVAKVNIEYLDVDGNTTDQIGDQAAKARYQRQLERSGKYSGLRFIIIWQAPSTPTPNLVIKLEARGEAPGTDRETSAIRIRAYPQKTHISGWAILDIQGESLKRFGRLKSWKVTILQNNEPMVERRSFMWRDPDPPAEKKPTATEIPSTPAPTDKSASTNSPPTQSP
jgi:hypothetical protein